PNRKDEIATKLKKNRFLNQIPPSERPAKRQFFFWGGQWMTPQVSRMVLHVYGMGPQTRRMSTQVYGMGQTCRTVPQICRMTIKIPEVTDNFRANPKASAAFSLHFIVYWNLL
ncbi:MAG: hypothetical protein OSJ42_08815, partial [Bacteroidales bacterium]|nr:hypothetical protein [Bacteroidales bacterium]